MYSLSSLLSLLLISSAIIILFLFISLSIFLLSIYMGKLINSPLYPPVMGTVYHQLFYFDRLYDHKTEILRHQRTFRLLALSISEIYTADPQNIEHVLKNVFDDYSKGAYNLTITRDLFGDGIFTVDGDKWRQQRKLASFEFSTRVLRDFSCKVFREKAVKLVRIVSELADTKTAFDIQDLLMKSGLDSMFKVGFGMDLNCLEGTSKEGSEFIAAFDESNALIFRRYVDFLWKIKRFLNVGSEAVLRRNIKTVDNFVYGVIHSKREKLSKGADCNNKEDMLSRFLMESTKDPIKMTDKYLRDIILNFIIAGKDSTSNTLSWFFYMICKNPLIQEKIARQLREIVGDDGGNIEDFVVKLTDPIFDKMQYLHAALTETLRLYPAVPQDGLCAGRDDVLPDGHRVKKGDGVYYVAYAMGRMPYLWGDDAEEFRPERWIHDGVFRPESPFKFVSFHAGPRSCLGKEFAYRQMKIIAMVLLRFFRFQLEDEKKEVRYKTTFTLRIDGGLNLRVFPRTQ